MSAQSETITPKLWTPEEQYEQAIADALSSLDYKGFVYFLFARSVNRVKIGYSQTPYERLSTLKGNSPVDVELLGMVPGSKKLEERLHTEFRKHRHHGEWFHLTEKLRTRIDCLIETWDHIWDIALEALNPGFDTPPETNIVKAAPKLEPMWARMLAAEAILDKKIEPSVPSDFMLYM
jgi:hypothetical protein